MSWIEGGDCREGISKQSGPGHRHSTCSEEVDDRRLTRNQDSSCGRLDWRNFVVALSFQESSFALRLRRIRASLRAWYGGASSFRARSESEDAMVAGVPEGASIMFVPSFSEAVDSPVLEACGRRARVP